MYPPAAVVGSYGRVVAEADHVAAVILVVSQHEVDLLGRPRPVRRRLNAVFGGDQGYQCGIS